MARKPALSGTSLRMLGVVAQQSGTLATLCKTAKLSLRSSGNALRKLQWRGLVSLGQGGIWSITQAGSTWLAECKPVTSGQGTKPHRHTRGLRARAWWLMRELGRWTLPDLLTTLADGSEGNAEANLRRWLMVLERAEIVARLKRQANGLPIWRLVHDLGREPPVWRRAHDVVFDPNSGKTFPLAKEDRHE